MSVILFILILLVLVVVHEFGHFIVAKKSGIRVDEFAFGFPPRLFSVKKGETTYSFNAIPFGGYVKIFGENPDEESLSGPDSTRSFVNKPRRVQAAVLFAGVFFNILLAWLLFSVGFMSGLPTSLGAAPVGSSVKDPALVITSVNKDSPAALGGLKTGDKVVALFESQTPQTRIEHPDADQLRSFVASHGEQQIIFEIVRGKTNETVTVTPHAGVNGNTTPAVGVAIDMIGTLKLPVHKALWEGLKLTGNLTWGTIKAFGTLIGNAFTGNAHINDVTGPVGIVGVVGDAARFGFIYLLSFTALISINLAVINLVPFPALDGGRLLFLLIEKIKGSRISPKIANLANVIGFGILIILMIVITYHDIVKLL
jgi:regulator of sigma E protease